MTNHAPEVVLEDPPRTSHPVAEFPEDIKDVEFRYGPDTILVRPFGPSMDSRTATRIVSAVREEFAGRRRPVRRLLLDLESVLVPSSMAIGLLLEMAKLASGVGGTLEVAAESKFREILGMLKLDGRYTMARSGRRLADSVR